MRKARGSPERTPLVLYVCYEFPVLTQTFTVTEVRGLLDQGLRIEVVSCRRPRGSPSGLAAAEIPVRNLPPPFTRSCLLSFARWVVRRPVRLLALIGTVAAGSYRDQPLRCWGRGFPQLLWGLRLAEELRGRARAIHLHAQFVDAASTVSLVAARLLDATFTVTNHTAYNPYLLRAKLAAADRVISISEFDRRSLLRLGRGTGAKKITVARQGVDVHRFAGLGRPPPGPPLRVLSVAALREKKGHHVLVEAFAGLLRSGTPAELTIVGEGPERPRLATRIAELGLRDSVHLVGAEPPERVRERLAEAHVFVLAALRARNGDLDGIPISLMEAMAAGVPVVSTRISGIPELVRDGVEGLLAAPGDPRGLGERLAAVAADPAAAASRAAAASERVRERHDAGRCVRAFARILREVAR
jgi:glycosyltransferase involved in cell wall biosynthesis